MKMKRKKRGNFFGVFFAIRPSIEVIGCVYLANWSDFLRKNNSSCTGKVHVLANTLQCAVKYTSPMNLDVIQSHGLTKLLHHVLGEKFKSDDYLRNIPGYDALRK